MMSFSFLLRAREKAKRVMNEIYTDKIVIFLMLDSSKTKKTEKQLTSLTVNMHLDAAKGVTHFSS